MGLRQFVSSPIGVVDFTGGTFRQVFSGKTDNTSHSPFITIAAVRLYHQDGTLTTLYDPNSSDYDTKLGLSFATKTGNTVNLASVISQANDRLVLDTFILVTNGGSGASHINVNYGDPIATADYAYTSGLTTTLDPWVEFNLANRYTQNISGSMSFAAALLLKPSHLYFTAALNFVGSNVGHFSKRLFQAALNLIGVIPKSVLRPVTASFHPAALGTKATSTRRTGTLSFAVASFSPIHLFNMALTATLSFVGNLRRDIFRRITALLQFAPNFIGGKVGAGLQYFQTILANLNFSTAVQQFISSIQPSTLGLFSGGANLTSSSQSGSVSFVGQQVRKITRAALTALLSLLGNLTQQKAKIFAGVLNFSSTIRRQIGSIQASVLGLSGFLPKFIDLTGDAFNAVLSFIGLRVDTMQLLVQGATVMRITATGGLVMKVTAKEK